MPVVDIPRCTCGLMMHETKDGSLLYFCRNCDRLQPVELEDDENGDRKKRVKTAEDHRFHLGWRQKIAKYFPNQPRDFGA